MEAVILLVIISILIVVIFAAANKDQQTTQRYAPTRRIPKIDVPVRVTVSYGASSSANSRELSGPPADPDKLWVPAGREVTIKGIHIPGGMIYVGKNLRPGSAYRQVEPALIDPDKSVDSSHLDIGGSSLTYWPTYADLSPGARAAYLTWLSQGRRTPGTNIGYVFLFFYGLERRLLIDSNTSAIARGEAGSIIGEAEQLLYEYGTNGSFSGYAAGFLEYARAKFLPDSISFDPAKLSRTWYFPLSLKLALARFAETANPLTSELALAWVRCDPQRWLRTPAHRCREEFNALFASRYHAKFGEGVVLKSNKSKIRIEYRPASGGLIGLPFAEDLDKPDITALTSPLKSLHDIADSCVDDLQAYSRLIGRRPEDAHALLAVALLPDEILATSSSEKVAELKLILEHRSTAIDPCIFKMYELLPLFEIEGKEMLKKAEAVSVAQLLGRLGYAIIPDVRFDEGRVDAQSSVLVYRCAPIVQSASGKEYDVSLMLLKIAFAVSASDNQVPLPVEKLLESQIEKMLDLSEFERERLRKYLLWLHLSPPELSQMKRKMNELPEARKNEIADFALRIANADGIINPEEVNILKRIYVLMGLDPEQVFSDIHRIQTSAQEELPTVSTQPKTIGYRIPVRRGAKTKEGSVTLDERLIERTLQDTAAVQSILAEVFAEPECPQPAMQAEQIGLMGLDSSHSSLLQELLARPDWAVPEFESLCAKHGILPGGAIETINTKSYDSFNEPLIEEGDTIGINIIIAKELRQ
jgi:uncharacterized tellurite resistance protein B-like protein